MSFFARNLQIFKRIGLPLYVLTLIYTCIDQLLTINTEAALRSTTGATGWIWGYGFASLFVGIIFPIMGSLVVIYGAKTPQPDEKGLIDFVHDHLNSLSIEILRSWGKSLLWGLLFILPGILKYFEFIMIPFIVTLSKRYEEGKEDALKSSTRLVRRNVLKIAAIILIFHFFFPVFLTVMFDDYRLVWQTPISAAVLTLIDVYLFIFSTQLLLNIFESQNAEAPHAEAHV